MPVGAQLLSEMKYNQFKPGIMKEFKAIFLFLLMSIHTVFAQYEHHNMNMQMKQPSNTHKVHTLPKKMGKDTSISHKHQNMTMSGMDMSHGEGNNMSGMDMSMSHILSLNLPMNRNGSGTSWLPDNAAMYGYMLHKNGWMFMFHGDIFLRYNKQDVTKKGSRGGSKVDAPDMLMAMGQKQFGKRGLFHFSTMFSADAIIAGGSGYPLLFQTGESWNGVPLVDRQHPHDLFSELAVSYSYAFSKRTDAFIYLGYPGEPALGPVTFMHRPSGRFDPDAPISHHWVDATHITFGVATIGLRYGKFKLEGSSFTGREPDEKRYNFDKPRFDSWSGRLSFNPDNNWALQISHGFIKSPEALHSDEDISRTTASATYSYNITPKTFFDATALWGVNRLEGMPNSNAALLEANLKHKNADVYIRYEWVQKSGEELKLNPTLYGLNSMYPINATTLGFSYDVFGIKKLKFAAGTQFTLYHADSKLDNLYGPNPFAWELYLHIYPGPM